MKQALTRLALWPAAAVAGYILSNLYSRGIGTKFIDDFTATADILGTEWNIDYRIPR